MTQQSFEGATSSESTEWGTPDDIYLPLDQEFHFVFDLAATPDNSKVSGKFFTKEDDALSKEWSREGWNWLNPPYDRRIRCWISYTILQREKGSSTVMLLKNGAEMDWFFRYAIPQANEIRFIRKRVRHLKNGIQGNGSYHPSLILVFNADTGISIPKRRVIPAGYHDFLVI